MKPLIMIIDDDPDFIDILTMTLSDDFAIQSYTNPLEAIERSATTEFKAILSDMNMPQMQGPDVVKALRRHNQQVPIILVTGFGRQDREVQDALMAGGTEVILKPIRDLNFVTTTIRKLVNL